MRKAFAVLALGLCTFTTGCRLAVHFARNLAYEPMRYTDDVVECYRNERLARAAWDHVVAGHREQVYSKDYERGFKNGYADYLRYRGPGTPPPIPPKCYWNQHYQTPEGHAAIEDWYAGFLHGANAARESWRAPFLTVPTHAEGPDPVRTPMPAEASPGTEEALPLPAKELSEPAPKPVKEPTPAKQPEGADNTRRPALSTAPVSGRPGRNARPAVVPATAKPAQELASPVIPAAMKPARMLPPGEPQGAEPVPVLTPTLVRPPMPMPQTDESTFRGTPYSVVPARPVAPTPVP